MAARPDSDRTRRDSSPRLLPTTPGVELDERLRLRRARVPRPLGTLGSLGLATRVLGPRSFRDAILVQPFDADDVRGLDPTTIRSFRWDARARTMVPVWNSGINVVLGYVWTRIRSPGIYAPIGLPRDRLLNEAIRHAALERRIRADRDEALRRTTNDAFVRELLALPEGAVEELRALYARIEIQTAVGGMSPRDVELGEGGHPAGFELPGGVSFDELRKRLRELEIPPSGLPEENLFYSPDIPRNDEPPWNRAGAASSWDGYDWRVLGALKVWHELDVARLEWPLPPWLFSRDWWMYQHDVRHTGHASGPSDISSTTVSNLYLHATATVDGPIITKPSIVDGKVYIGSGRSGGVGGTLYRIDLGTGGIERTLPTSGTAFYSWFSGIGGSPAIVAGRVYFTGVHGTAYCVDANTFAPIWSVSLKVADAGHNQPVTNANADSWSGPLVVNGRVYVGCGEGESDPTYGFLFCLDAATGAVEWCFCTSQFTAGADNQPNHLPAAVAAPWAAAHGFTVQANPPQTGCCIWSSCAYDYVNDSVYVGTGNSQYPHTSQPDELYGSGLLSLDASTGAFRGFFQPSADDSYWPGDSDIDVPGSPTVYWAGGQRLVAFGTKAGSFFVVDAANIGNVIARRQLLPRVGGSGLPGDRGTPIPAVVPTGGTGENSYGILGTPAIHAQLGRVFVGLGGYNGMALDAETGIDQTRTPFLRAVNWDSLLDAWPTSIGADGVSRYATTRPPMYLTREVALSSPAVVSDVVFVSTSPPPTSQDRGGLYALSADDGHCLWSAGGLVAGAFALGPTVYGNYVVVGAGRELRIYRLGPRWRFPWIPPIYRPPWPWEVVERPPVPIDPPADAWIGPDPGAPIREGR